MKSKLKSAIKRVVPAPMMDAWRRMVKDELLRRAADKARRTQEEFRRNLSDTISVSAMDMMLPLDGRVTAAQLIVVSRVLDTEAIHAGKKPIWHTRLHDLTTDITGGKPLSEREVMEADDDYKELVASLDKYGLVPDMSPVYITRKPLAFWHGTHRLGWALSTNPLMIVSAAQFNDGWDWAFSDGSEFWLKHGMSKSELSSLKHRHADLLACDIGVLGVVDMAAWREYSVETGGGNYFCSWVLRGNRACVCVAS